MQSSQIPEEFKDIRPYADDEVRGAIHSLLHDRHFGRLLKGFVPFLPLSWSRGLLRLASIGVNTTLDFQMRFMKPVVRYILHRYSTGHTFVYEGIKPSEERYTFVSNHRDIVLDSAILDLMLHDAKFPTTVEIAIGDNLLIYPWIRTLVRLNKAFVVQRSLSMREKLRASQTMSRYMHFAVNEKQENIWIAQREGRAKDSDDRTQDSVLKMLNMGGPTSGRTTADIIENLRHMNIVPLAISYEYDPCDYLKAKEFQCKRDIPGWKKAKQDDLDNMKTGIWGKKGHVHYQAADCINTWLDTLDPDTIEKADIFRIVAEHIDHEIHKNYRIYDINRDALAGTENAYIEERIKMVDVENPDVPFLREKLTAMYANPLRNYEKAVG